MDFATPELMTILIPKRLARISVVRLPSMKLIRSGQESEEDQGEFRYQNGSQDELHAVLLL